MTLSTNAPIIAVVVTFNRRALLERCLAALQSQTLPPSRILVIDNASTDGTGPWLADLPKDSKVPLNAVTLPTNGGGAGGFADGMRLGLDLGADWLWMMDDDAEPHPDALAKLMGLSPRQDNIYASLAVAGERTSWVTTLVSPETREVALSRDVPECAEVLSVPFLGFLIHRSLAGRLGLPDRGYFIAADDIEYCLRARRAGARIYIAGGSHIEHPPSVHQKVKMFGKSVTYLSLPPWKRYYDTRNRLLNARRYHGAGLLTEALPGTFIRLFAALRHEPRKMAQLWAFSAGIMDGLLGRTGARHTAWRIQP